MRTLYIDVFFLINFAVDTLAIYAALKLSSIKAKTGRVMFGGVIGAVLAIVDILVISMQTHRLIMEIGLILFLACYVCGGISIKRRLKFSASFYFSVFLISGAVNYFYELLDKYFAPIIETGIGGENRNVLKFSLLILLIIGVLRILIMVFTNSISEKSIRLYISIDGKTLELDALIDSGNLVKDPMNMSPVIFLKSVAGKVIFPDNVTDLCDINKLDITYQKRIRLIPVTRDESTHVMIGIRADEISVYNRRGKREMIEGTVVIDKEEGTYGGFEALVPYAAVSDAL